MAVRTSHNFTIAVVLALACAVDPGAQSLGEVAKKEEVRRKQVAKPGKTYTNESLRGASQPPPSAAGAPAPAPPAADAAPAEASEDKPDLQKDRAHWASRIKQARESLERTRTFEEALQTRINSLQADFVSRDDPAQRNVVEQNLKKALAELERVKKEAAGYEKSIADIEEEARRAGVPPGWLRTP